eukprot:gnl/MRDRNA2_/MRDRNA2_134534_c0_seq1.p1 gnl/MRDRNA2_/MRDRNA2_134534_c0~~gnl/MRDRNA2_/MRDRNA2_134534_c0_seq1.p1  ORF type:complete len:128 (+),score=10.37 gnl/MRDRNA2_/MRDRNA2_134534_c0_seq1:87-470(+)
MTTGVTGSMCQGRSFLILVLCIPLALAGTAGNVCRCICGGHRSSNLTLLVPASRACEDCTAEACRHHFGACQYTDAITVHCINRYAIGPQLAINSMILLCIFLVVLACCKEQFPLAKKLYNIGKGET